MIEANEMREHVHTIWPVSACALLLLITTAAFAQGRDGRWARPKVDAAIRTGAIPWLRGLGTLERVHVPKSGMGATTTTAVALFRNPYAGNMRTRNIVIDNRSGRVLVQHAPPEFDRPQDRRASAAATVLKSRVRPPSVGLSRSGKSEIFQHPLTGRRAAVQLSDGRAFLLGARHSGAAARPIREAKPASGYRAYLDQHRFMAAPIPGGGKKMAIIRPVQW